MNNFKASGEVLFNKLVIVILVFMMIPILSGCEPLRKKFKRKKKKSSASAEIMPILDPIEYPEKIKSVESKYKHFYSLWRVWHRDMMIAFLRETNDKRMVYYINQLIVQLDELQQLVIGEKKQELLKFKSRLENIKLKYDKPAGLRNKDGMKKEVGLIGKKIMREFKIDKMKDSLVR